MKKTAKAFAPAAISSFFEICDQKINENHNDIGLQHLGSRGGGFGLQKGVLTEAIRTAYAKRAGSDKPYPDFR